MVYLLQSRDSLSYILFERIDTDEIFYSHGEWSMDIPTKFEDAMRIPNFTKNGKPLSWWKSCYPDYVDAKVIVRCKTHNGYYKWMRRHPELFI